MSRSRDKVARLWQIIEALRTRRRGLTARELIDLTGASRPTVYRDLELLEDIGAPLIRERIDGEVRHRLADVCRIALASHEIAALAVARQMLEPLEGLRVVESLDALLRRAGRARAVAIPPVGIAGVSSGNHRGTVRAIDLAIRHGHRIGFHYRAASSGRYRRRVDPISIRLHRGQPYLVAFDTDRDDWRIFKLSRIEGEIELEGQADAHPDYDEQELFRHSVGVWSGDPVQVAVELSADVASLAGEYRLTDDQTIEKTTAGGAVVRATVAGTAETARWVLSWGADARVLEPLELQDAVRDQLAGALEGYEREAGRGSEETEDGVSNV